MADTAHATDLSGRQQVWVERVDGRIEPDWVVVEEPLEIRVDGKPLVMTLRTPGADRELAVGFLFSEGILRHPQQIEAIEFIPDPGRPGQHSAIGLLLRADAQLSPERLRERQRDFLAAAGCGFCGQPPRGDVLPRPHITPLVCSRELIATLPDKMRQHQTLFAQTGGLHAAALFDPQGHLLALREDIGRHNAVDKLIGHFLLQDTLPWENRILAVSARAGFEIVQKAAVAGVPVLVAVGAASSLAIQLAKAHGITLYSFVAGSSGNRHL
jgi:FdhD protein